MKLVIHCNFGEFDISERTYFELIRRDSKCLTHNKQSISEFMALIGEESRTNFLTQLFNYKDEFWKHPNYPNTFIRSGFVYRMTEYLSEYRYDSTFIQIVEESPLSGENFSLKVIEIPDDIQYYIDSDNGSESVHENHRVWR